MATYAYREDYHAWALQTAELIRTGHFGEIDTTQLAEELEDMGASRERELESRLGILLAHLLKWRYQPERRGASWEATIKEQRQRIARLLRKNPSLKASLEETHGDAYSDARLIARRETGLPEAVFPQDCTFRLEQTLGDFWPEENGID
jgi:ribosomal protein L29